MCLHIIVQYIALLYVFTYNSAIYCTIQYNFKGIESDAFKNKRGSIEPLFLCIFTIIPDKV